jgi:hypothetical protein
MFGFQDGIGIEKRPGLGAESGFFGRVVEIHIVKPPRFGFGS